MAEPIDVNNLQGLSSVAGPMVDKLARRDAEASRPSYAGWVSENRLKRHGGPSPPDRASPRLAAQACGQGGRGASSAPRHGKSLGE